MIRRQGCHPAIVGKNPFLVLIRNVVGFSGVRCYNSDSEQQGRVNFLSICS